MSFAILILAYTNGNNLLEQCIESIRKHNPDTQICVVDAHPGTYIPTDQKIRYHCSGFNGYELGSLASGVKFYQDVQRFLVIHDSCLIHDVISVPEKNQILFTAPKFDIAPALGIVRNWLRDIRVDSGKFSENWHICQGLMGFFSRDVLENIFSTGLEQVRVSSKIEAVASEGIFGFLLYCLYPEITSEHSRIYDYISSCKAWKWISKIAVGRGHTPLENRVLSLAEMYGESFLSHVKSLHISQRNIEIYRKMLDDSNLVRVLLNEKGHPYNIIWKEDVMVDDIWLGPCSWKHIIFAIVHTPKTVYDMLKNNH